MVIKRHKPSLDGILKRRRSTAAQYFAHLGVDSHDKLVVVLESLLGAYRVSEQLQEEAFAWVATLPKPEPAQEPQAIPQKEEEQTEAQEPEPPKKKPKRPPRRSTKRSTTKKKSTPKKTESE